MTSNECTTIHLLSIQSLYRYELEQVDLSHLSVTVTYA